MSTRRIADPTARDRALRRLRLISWSLAAGAAGLTAALSSIAAAAFKGRTAHVAVATSRATAAPPRVATVPGPQPVPAIERGPATTASAPAPPPAPPVSAPAPSAPAPAPTPPPVTSGAS
jgi:DNA polymerase-3 subunit gamma/tau